jgi:hypothetical protein
MCASLLGVLSLALVAVELFLEVRLSIGSSRECAHGCLEFAVAKGADRDRRGHAEPLDDPEIPLWVWIVLDWHWTEGAARRETLTALLI